jgi:hypothetical protein
MESAHGTRRVAWAVALLTLAGLLLRQFLHYRVFSLYIDDAYIFMRYAENFAAGRGLVFNPGEPVMGYTSPLFTLLLGGLAWLFRFVPLEIVVNLLNSALFLLVARLLYRTAKETQRLVWLMPLLWALYFPYVDAGINGMETMMFITGILLTAHLLMTRRYDWGSLAAIGTGLTRPEGLMLCIAVLGLLVVLKVRPFPWRGVLIGLGFVVLWTAIATMYYGSVVPQSMLAKSALVSEGLGGTPMTMWDKIVAISFGITNELLASLPHAVTLALWLIEIILLGFFIRGVRLLWQERSLGLCVPGFFVLVWLFYVLGNPVQLWTWYTIPPSIAFFWTLTIPIARWFVKPGREHALHLAAAGALAVFIGSIVVGVPKRLERMKLATWQIRDSAEWVLREHPDAKSIAVADIGILAWQTKKHIVDLASLVTRTTSRVDEDGKLISLGAILQEQKPDVLFLRSDPRNVESVFEAMVRRRSFDNAEQKIWFDENYDKVDLANAWYVDVFVRKREGT